MYGLDLLVNGAKEQTRQQRQNADAESMFIHFQYVWVLLQASTTSIIPIQP